MVLVRLLVILLLIRETLAIVLKNGGYEDVYVIILDSNSESDFLLKRIQNVMTSASKLLFTATHNRLYFRKIKIIVPTSWPSKPEYKQLPINSIKESYFSVDVHGYKAPHTKGLFMCGKGGHYMHLSPTFLDEGRSDWGLHDRVIVHEWGHLRWGLYNELPVGAEKFYQADGKWNPVRCTDSIDGDVGLYEGGKCKRSNECNINDASKKMNKKCSFCPYRSQDVDASLMGNQWIHKLSDFCDEDVSTVKKEHRHNRFAPTEQNKQCNYRSAWEVMREHKDFQTVTKLPTSTNTVPEFEIIRETTSYRVFVFDISGSMEGSRMTTLQQTADYVIQELISNGTWLGIVSFSTNAAVEKDIIEINTQTDRDDLKNAVPTEADGWTCIGCGLMEATKLLSEKKDSLQSNVSSIDFTIEDGLGKDTAFTFMTPVDRNIQLQLNGPNSYTQFLETYGNNATLYVPDIAQAGEYTMTVTTDEIPGTAEYHVKSVMTSDDVVRVTSMLSTNNIDFSSGELPVIFTDVTKSYLSVLNATVSASVETNETSCDVRLKDDGIDPDAVINDGTYSGYIFPDCLSYGRVSIKVNVKGNKRETMILKSVTGAANPFEVDEKPVIYERSFQRVEVLEELYVTNYKDTGTSDVIAPGRISDVSLYHIRKESTSQGEVRNFTITWTATGDDKNVGQASSYILRISDDFETLLNDFDSAEQLEMGNVSLIPQESGEKEALKIVVDAEKAYTETSFFAIQAVDEAGNKGDVSNIISIVVAKGYRAAGEEGTLTIEDDKDNVTSIAECNCGMKLLIVVQIIVSFVYVLY
ncbi:calcium-activated chloride channel regulator 1-like isoform X2 [Mercenaria mercenaria]|uniref:calcium-activated chloride channel regulator 1-like isoform X2 n=1 Tax=Mercenaria mercenaria TaxID=6596 RepID=UPI00234F8782|nr:calcium-activated chloride channel regulator 1-like isoform X2 [Mercenaria mercenaria]